MGKLWEPLSKGIGYKFYSHHKSWLPSEKWGHRATLQDFSNNMSEDTCLEAGASVSRKARLGWLQLGEALLGRPVIQGLLACSISFPCSAHLLSPGRHWSHRMTAASPLLWGEKLVWAKSLLWNRNDLDSQQLFLKCRHSFYNSFYFILLYFILFLFILSNFCIQRGAHVHNPEI